MTTTGGSTRRSFRLVTWVAISVLILAVVAITAILLGYDKDHEFLSNLGLGPDDLEDAESMFVMEMKERLQPKELLFQDAENKTLVLHQFLHLHQMKTGGTSMDNRLKCAMNRLRNDHETVVPYGNIHECSHGSYYACR
jgi:hypothetical protein